MSEITYKITRPIAVLSETEKGYTIEANMMIWNDGEEKLDIRHWHPEHKKCSRGITLTEDEGRKLLEALKKLYK